MKKILIIDDEPQIRSIFQEILESEGYAVTTASNGDKGILCLEQDSFDVIILDKKMPFRSGPDFIKETRDKVGSAKILLVSGSPPQTDIPNVSGFLPKPCEINLLIDTVNRLTQGE